VGSALNRFRDRYGAKAGVGKDATFAYVYAVLQDPVYRETFAINLRREFPASPSTPTSRAGRTGASA
jgi:predicted helicase